MQLPTESIIRRATRKPHDKLNILVMPTHERYETSLAKTGHSFYAIRTKRTKDWEIRYAHVPDNYHLLDMQDNTVVLPDSITFDLVISQNKDAQFSVLNAVAKAINVPLINIEHTLPNGPRIIEIASTMVGDVNVYVSEHQRDMWETDGVVIHTGIDTDTFVPPRDDEVRGPHVLSIANDWINRDKECGFTFWKDAVGYDREESWFQYRVLGHTPGFSTPAPDVPSLVREYQQAGVFLNTTQVSSLPTVILEAMSCETPVVSTDTCLIPKIIIEDGKNGFVGHTPEELRELTIMLLNNKRLAQEVGKAGRRTILDKFSQDRFVREWSEVLKRTVHDYKGVL